MALTDGWLAQHASLVKIRRVLRSLLNESSFSNMRALLSKKISDTPFVKANATLQGLLIRRIVQGSWFSLEAQIPCSGKVEIVPLSERE